jgi:hypothetical protein
MTELPAPGSGPGDAVFPEIALVALSYEIADMLGALGYPIDAAGGHIRRALPGFLQEVIASAASDGVADPEVPATGPLSGTGDPQATGRPAGRQAVR